MELGSGTVVAEPPKEILALSNFTNGPFSSTSPASIIVRQQISRLRIHCNGRLGQCFLRYREQPDEDC